jgi:sortase A
VEEVALVDSRTAVIRVEPGATALVLITCYPFDALAAGGPLRYVVTALGAAEQPPPSIARP